VKRAVAAAVLAIGLVGLTAFMLTVPELPDYSTARARHASSEAVLLDRNGEVIHERRVDLGARRLAWTALGAIAPALIETVIAAEDHRFRSHSGVDWLAVAGVLRDGASGRHLRGASTIPMQLAALLEPSGVSGQAARRITRKWRQMCAAWWLDRHWSKDEMLEAYLNLASFRGELVGVTTAARGLFDREPHGLNAAQSAVLAALLPAPNTSPERVADRACRLAGLARVDASCDQIHATAAAALARPPRVRAHTELALHVATQLLGGAADARVATTLDASLQRSVRDILQRQVLSLAERNVRDAAALVADNASGEVLAYVGGIGPLASAPWVDGVRSPRQAGSSLKPFLYARALDRRLVTAATRLHDAPLEIGTPFGSYRPENYDRAFRGRVPVRTALAASLNVPAVRLLQLVGVEDLVAALDLLGFSGLRDEDHYGASLALGSADVSLWELAGAWRSLARGGLYTPLRLQPAASNAEPRRVFAAEAAFITLDILADRASRAPAFGFESPLASRVWSAAKTGTSQDMRDNWCVGTTSRFTVAVWIGNASGAPMWDVSGVDGAAPAWLEIVHTLHRDEPSDPPAPPSGVIRADGEWFLAGTEPPDLVPLAAASVVDEPIVAARIVAPQQGAVIALDPDIPDSRERVWLEASPPDARLVLRLDGKVLGAGADPVLWAPQRGEHELALVSSEGRVLDVVSFSVR
jgi:penicillin-binding protein 1C